jgi:hypothetical protein
MQKAVCFINGVSIRDAPGFPCVIKDAQQIPQAVILMDQHRLGIVVHLFALSLAIRPKRGRGRIWRKPIARRGVRRRPQMPPET